MSSISLKSSQRSSAYVIEALCVNYAANFIIHTMYSLFSTSVFLSFQYVSSVLCVGLMLMGDNYFVVCNCKCLSEVFYFVYRYTFMSVYSI